MAGTNVTVIGNVTRDPELRFTTSGKAVVTFGVAVNNRIRKADGSFEDGEPDFYDISAWDTLAENVSESLVKGMRVVISGRLDYRTWTDKESGANRSKVEVVADEVGPSLRWATAEVTKNQRSNSESNRAPAAAGARSNGGGGGGEYAYDEEPF